MTDSKLAPIPVPAPPFSRKVIATFLTGLVLTGAAALGLHANGLEEAAIVTAATTAAGVIFADERKYLDAAIAYLNSKGL